MIFYLYMMGLAFVFVGGFCAADPETLWAAVLTTGVGALMLGVIDATRERLLREVTQALNAHNREHHQ